MTRLPLAQRLQEEALNLTRLAEGGWGSMLKSASLLRIAALLTEARANLKPETHHDSV